MNKLIKQIARFYLDGKLHWDMLDDIDKIYLIVIGINEYPLKEGEGERRMRELCPFFFENDK